MDHRSTLSRSVALLRGIPAAVLSLLAPPLLAAGMTADDIPRLPEWSVVSSHQRGPERLEAELRRTLPEGLTFQEISDRGVETAERCVELMKAGGWELESENWQRRGGEFHFKKRPLTAVEVSVGPDAEAREGRMRPHIALRYELTRLVPVADILGADPPDVPRFPGSVRVRWMNLLGDFAAKYLVVGSADEVGEFFARRLPELGWEPGKGAGTLNFTRSVATPAEPLPAAGEGLEGAARRIGGMIPTTLSIHLSARDGLVEIGVGRAAGGAAVAGELEITPPAAAEERRREVLTFIDADEIPVYPGLTLTSRRRQPITLAGEEILRTSYEQTDAEASEALRMAEFYLRAMADRGFVPEEDEWHGIGRRLLYRRGAVRVRIEIQAVGRYPLPERVPRIRIPVQVDLILPIPTAEPAGKDIPGVPRFPGSVRFHTLEAGIDHAVKYKAAASVGEVERFFVDRLPEHGWRFAGNDSTGLLFVPSATAGSPSEALASGKLIPTTLKVKVDDSWDGTVKIGLNLTRGDT